MTTTSSEPPSRAKVPLRVRLRRNTAIVARWLHLYLSMISFAVVLFFAVTGLTLNHPAWFADQQRTSVRRGTIEPRLLSSGAGGSIDRLGVVEALRTREHLHGAVSEVREDPAEVEISLRAPGYTADANIDRRSGRYDLTEVSSGFVAVINDLHKGRDSGKGWSVLIDASAVLLVLVSLSGLLLLWFVYKRRLSGFVLAAMGAAAAWVVYRTLVP